MRKSKHTVSIILLLAIILLSWSFCAAQDAGDASSALCEYGIKLHKQGQIEDAIHELKKALIINPYNLKAKNYLMKIYSERGLPVEPLAVPARKIKIGEYEDQIKQLREDTRYYQKQLNALNEQIAAKEAELERLDCELNSQRELFSKKEQDLFLAHKGRQEKIAGLENQISRLQKETGDYQKQLTSLNAQYLAKEAELEKLDRQLQAYKGRRENIAGLENQISRLQKETGDYQKQLASLNAQYLAKEAELERLNRELGSQKELLGKKEQELLQTQRGRKSRVQELEKQINKFKKHNLAYQDRLNSLKKQHLTDLASKRKELAKLRADYESRLKIMETNLRTKQSFMIDECQPTWIEGHGLLDDIKEKPQNLECELDQEFLSTGALEFAEKQGLTSWEKLNHELQVLMPTLYEEDFFYAGDAEPEFQELKMEESKDIDLQAMLSDLDN